jgi:hypothetical protein
MNEQALAKQIAAQVLQNTQFWIAMVGVIGGVVGGMLTVAGNLGLHWLKNQGRRRLERKRKNHLQRMLELKDWRKLSTLSRVIGADADTTKRLLIEIEARGSEIPRDDGEEVWGFVSKHPLEKIE